MIQDSKTRWGWRRRRWRSWGIGFIPVIGLSVGGCDPKTQVAGWFWPSSAAPWEQVDAFYYPDRNNLLSDERHLNVGSVEACRAWVSSRAAARGDPSIALGDYECGVGYLRNSGDMRVYRLTEE
jgi:hypothetical protein